MPDVMHTAPPLIFQFRLKLPLRTPGGLPGGDGLGFASTDNAAFLRAFEALGYIMSTCCHTRFYSGNIN